MAAGINIDITANTRDFLRGAKDVEGSLDGVSDSLDDITRDAERQGSRAGTELARGIDDGSRDASKSLDKIGDGLDDTARDARRSSEQIGDSLGDGITGGTRNADRSLDKLERSFRQLRSKAAESTHGVQEDLETSVEKGATTSSEAMTEIKGEAIQNASETFSSFDGSSQSLVDGLQGTFGGLVASIGPLLGPAGMFAAMAGAAGIGLVTSALGNADEETEAFKEHVSDLAQQMIDAGRQGGRSFDDMASEIEDLATQTDESKTSLKDLRRFAEALHRPLGEVVAAYEAGGEPLRDLVDLGKQQLKVAEKSNDTNKDAYGWNLKAHGAIADRVKALKDSNKTLGEQKDALDAAAKAQKLAAKAGLDDYQLKHDLVEQLGDAYDDAAGDVSDYVDKESGLFDVKKYITSMEQRQAALTAYRNNLAVSGLTPEAKKFIEGQGEDTAAIMLAGYMAASPEQKKELDAIWTKAGSSAGDKAGQAIKDALPSQVKGPHINVSSNADSVKTEIERAANGYYQTWVTVNGRTRAGRRLF